MAKALDIDAIHRYVYRHSDRLHRYPMNAVTLADELGVSYYNFTVVVKKMVAAGRLRQISGRKFGAKTYVVEDPDVWGSSAAVG